jgi:NADH-quinone oxidoreductase subunit M
MLWTLQRVFLGTLKEKWSTLTDMNMREYFMLVPLSIIVIFLGVYPASMLNIMNTSVNAMVKFMAESKAIFSSLAGF